ncbi:hypothetical protein EHQ53_14320 [Leptospira langatensis]|uniref:Glycosyltransferase RgtA/B/C/D-like domain-containing protein n=1 Tax=Leptospira langatensis TaxID=2484983 RepID=A0A5F1ZQD9_9LEPT|nr:hypothetical protein [Leptospira langatensis]TGK01148.1 hypothetical protein EHO57_09365 [Leptospira langatensis]TGL39567.1 hypothetical protein EHQ53_14320 [Leptospira langatensis]
MSGFDWKKSLIKRSFLEPLAVLLIFTYLSFHNAWLSDDSFISFRVLDHFVNGFGLRWNIAERVQAFTNPLLVLLLSPFYYSYQNIVFWSFFSSFCFGLTTLYFLRKMAASSVAYWIGIGFLFSSRSFVDYSYSGLENSLNYLIEASFFYLYFKKEEDPNSSKLPTLVLLASLGLVSRIDFLLIFLLPLIFLFVKEWKERRINPTFFFRLLISASPAILWFLFSAVYYGSLLPNTYYSKTNVADSLFHTLRQGSRYYFYEFKWDPIVFLFLPTVLLLRSILKKKVTYYWAALGFSLPYLIYILFVGGDFMAGRFFTYVILLFGIAIVRTESLGKKEIYLLSSILIIYNIALSSTPIHTIRQQAKQNPWLLGREEIADEKLWYYPATGLSWYKKSDSILSNLAKKKPFFPPSQENVFIKYNTGVIGFFLPTEYIIDIVALGDPLLARIKGKGRVGHKIRHLPLGYFESVGSGENRISDPQLKEYYDSIILLTRGDLLDERRWGAFWEFQFGSKRKYIGPYSIDVDREKKMWAEEIRKKNQGINEI